MDMTTLQSQIARGIAVASSCPSSSIIGRSKLSQGAHSQAWLSGNNTDQWHGSAFSLFAGSVLSCKSFEFLRCCIV